MRIIAGWICVAALATTASAEERVRFAGLEWEARGEFEVSRYLGREALRVRGAFLQLVGVEFESGTIEFDVATSGHRSFLGAAFRIDASGSYEDFYLRPHNSGRFDAMQYTPVWQRASAWQLYPEHNASFVIPRQRWLAVRILVEGSRLQVYLDGDGEPVLTTERLRGPSGPGAVALKAFFPASSASPGFYPAAFSNFRLTPAEGLEVWDESPGPVDPGTITEWAVSQSFPGSEGAVEELPRDLVEAASWELLAAEASGRTNLARAGGVPEGERLGVKLARVVIESDRDRRTLLNFGFSDRASLFLNGRLVFVGDNSYLSRSGRYLGVMTRDNDGVVLDLERGANELLFVVTEAFGGWGVTARLRDPEGLTWSAPEGP